MTEVFVAGAYLGSPRTGVLTRWQARRKSCALLIFDPTHPRRILTVFGAPIAFVVTGFLHLVADGDAPDICTGLKGHVGLWIAIHVVVSNAAADSCVHCLLALGSLQRNDPLDGGRLGRAPSEISHADA